MTNETGIVPKDGGLGAQGNFEFIGKMKRGAGALLFQAVLCCLAGLRLRALGAK